MDVADDKTPHPAVVDAATLALRQWIGRIGEPGFAAMAVIPGLLAYVDQHVASVRDALARRDGSLRATDLAAYADGVADTSARRGWDVVAGVREVEWTAAPWPLVRLIAVCTLGRELVDGPGVHRPIDLPDFA